MKIKKQNNFDIVKNKIFLIPILILFLIAIMGFIFVNQRPICKLPYIEYKKGECCLDQNTNSICDKDELSGKIINSTNLEAISSQEAYPYLNEVNTIVNRIKYFNNLFMLEFKDVQNSRDRNVIRALYCNQRQTNLGEIKGIVTNFTSLKVPTDYVQIHTELNDLFVKIEKIFIQTVDKCQNDYGSSSGLDQDTIGIINDDYNNLNKALAKLPGNDLSVKLELY